MLAATPVRHPHKTTRAARRRPGVAGRGLGVGGRGGEHVGDVAGRAVEDVPGGCAGHGGNAAVARAPTRTTMGPGYVLPWIAAHSVGVSTRRARRSGPRGAWHDGDAPREHVLSLDPHLTLMGPRRYAVEPCELQDTTVAPSNLLFFLLPASATRLLFLQCSD